MLKLRVLKQIDMVAGKLACHLFPPPQKTTLPSGERLQILLIRPGGIGDAVLLAPTIVALRNTYPLATLSVLAEKRNAGVFPLISGLDQIWRYDQPDQLLQAIRSKPDLVIDTEQWHRLSAVVSRVTGAKYSLGYATNARKRLFTHAVKYSHDDYEVDSFLQLLVPLGLKPPEKPTVPFLTVPATDQQVADELLSETDPFVAIFPGASIRERKWGTEKFHQLGRQANEHGLQIVVIGSGDDYPGGEQILRGLKGRNLAGQTTLAQSAAVIERSKLLVSGDSGILHMAVGLDVPTVSLFGPGIAKKWAPRGENHIVLNKHLPCSPCTQFGYTPKCTTQGECLQRISVSEVMAAVMKLLHPE